MKKQAISFIAWALLSTNHFIVKTEKNWMNVLKSENFLKLKPDTSPPRPKKTKKGGTKVFLQSEMYIWQVSLEFTVTCSKHLQLISQD